MVTIIFFDSQSTDSILDSIFEKTFSGNIPPRKELENS